MGPTRNRTLFTAAATLAVLVGLFHHGSEPAAEAPRPGTYPFAFTDAGDAAGLFPHAANIWGHGAAWGDVDGDGWIDLYIATFHMPGSKPNLFFRNKKGKFELDPQKPLAVSTRGTGVLFADLDNDGRLDLFLPSWWPDACASATSTPARWTARKRSSCWPATWPPARGAGC